MIKQVTTLLTLFCLLLSGCGQTLPPPTTTTTIMTTTTALPDQKAERLAVWISYFELNTVFSACKTVADAEKAIDAMMDTVQAARMNTVFFHVRANGDAYYRSVRFAPAAAVSQLMTNGFDPLAYAVQAAHRRNIELHAWINPYRIGKDPQYAVEGYPTLQDAAGRQYYVPTASSVQQLILEGVREVLSYGVDGVQYDDYFYPENALEEETVYPFEEADYTTYRKGGGTLSVGNWRRAAVDSLVAGTHALVHATGAVFGISPSHNAQKTYTAMFADAKKWLAESGYVDYVCPQLYFGFDNETAAFTELADTWMAYPRDASVSLYAGLALYKIGLKTDAWAGENGKHEWIDHNDVIKRQILYARAKGYDGLCFYSFSYLTPEQVTTAEFAKSNDVTVAKQEIENLLTVL